MPRKISETELNREVKGRKYQKKNVPGWMDGLVGGIYSRFKDCLQQSKIYCLVFQKTVLVQAGDKASID